jgi:hypothetical protein
MPSAGPEPAPSGGGHVSLTEGSQSIPIPGLAAQDQAGEAGEPGGGRALAEAAGWTADRPGDALMPHADATSAHPGGPATAHPSGPATAWLSDAVTAGPRRCARPMPFVAGRTPQIAQVGRAAPGTASVQRAQVLAMRTAVGPRARAERHERPPHQQDLVLALRRLTHAVINRINSTSPIEAGTVGGISA